MDGKLGTTLNHNEINKNNFKKPNIICNSVLNWSIQLSNKKNFGISINPKIALDPSSFY